MNAQSYLQSFGWTPGSSLGNPLSHLSTSSPSNARLTKRILISAKNNTLGVGRKASNLNHADLWWEKAFDVSLKQLDVTKDTSAISQAEKDKVDNMNLFAELGGGRGFGGTAIAGSSGKSKRVDASGPLYRYFVRGAGLEGTISTTIIATSTAISQTLDVIEESQPRKKRKRDGLATSTDVTMISKAERKAMKAERKILRAERRAAKIERRRLRAERQAAKVANRQLKDEKKAQKSKKTKDDHAISEPGVQSDSGVDLSSDETSTGYAPPSKSNQSKPQKTKHSKTASKDRSLKRDKSKKVNKASSKSRKHIPS
ncbi:hypothetical protein Dda_0685 [Drechslerella dactyloides]|uniref:G-patch domain-containing protein n=1 Tax=Drechslerella dactyloides TaxID=74499 RepID=A0AAD6J4P6_DREDA|nr:hypothetical protein Dda_0685 [Drechslerella dactyloides]